VVLWGLFTAYVVLIRIWRANREEKLKQLPTMMPVIMVRSNEAVSAMQKFSTAIHVLNRNLKRQRTWLAQDPPRWLWPVFSPSPNRPFDWRID
jgi:hypothetical protein